jgi:hypothetical protein
MFLLVQDPFSEVFLVICRHCHRLFLLDIPQMLFIQSSWAKKEKDAPERGSLRVSVSSLGIDASSLVSLQQNMDKKSSLSKSAFSP